MLTSFFRKSRPVNFLLVFFPVILLFGYYNFIDPDVEKGWLYVGKKIAVLFFLMQTLFISNYIIIKDKTKRRHTYVLFLLGLFCVSSSAILSSNVVIIAGFFTALGLHRTIGMQNGKNIGKKVFEAFFYLTIAGLVFPTTFVFMLLPFWNILYYAPENYKNWFIPIPAVLSVLILKTVYALWAHDQFYNPISLFSFRNIAPETLNKPGILWPLALITLLTIWGVINTLTGRGMEKQLEKRGKYFLLSALILGGGTLLFSGNFPQNSEASLLFFYIPAALIGGRYLESKKDKWVKNILLLILIIMCPLLGILYSGG